MVTTACNTPSFPTLGRLLSAAAATAVLGLFSGAALGAPVVIYSNDFENPASTECPDYGSNARASALTMDYGSQFAQIQSADRLCVDRPADPDAVRFLDPSGKAGQYFVGFYGSHSTPVNESFGLVLAPPAGAQSIGGTVDFANVKLAGYNPASTSPNIGSPVSVTVNYYQLPAAEAGFAFDETPALGSPSPVRGTTSDTVLTPIQTDTVSVTNHSTGPDAAYTLDWLTHALSVDIRGFAPGDRLVIAFTGLAQNEYMAVDNLVITANTPEPAPVPADAPWALLLAGLGVGWLVRRHRRTG